MLPKKTITKRQKKKASRRKSGEVLIFFGLILIAISLFYTVFLEKEPLYVSPLSKNQTSVNSLIEKKIKEKKIVYESFETTKDFNFKVVLKEGGEVIIDRNRDINSQLSSLQLILSKLKIEGKALKRLDFRFEKPIISF